MVGHRSFAARVCAGLALALAACDSSSPAALPDGGRPDAGLTPCASDTECDDARYCNGREACMPGAADADARGCVAGAVPCMASQRCSEMEGRCVTSCAIDPDADGDGAASIDCGGSDCDDADPNRFVGNTEVCDDADRDEDCDPSTFGARDADGDGFVDSACCNEGAMGMRCGMDCNDARRDAHPGATEACEGIDNDCDGRIDEGLLVAAWPDRDYDLHGIDDDAMRAEVCPGTPGYAQTRDDCDDTSPVRHRAQLEICDAIDNDCDGLVDESPVSIPWYPDEDGDLFGAPGRDVVISCTPVPGYSTRSSDCNDADARVHPGAFERCNGADDDCNGYADAGGLRPGDTEDDDGDGVADVVCGGSDCDDANADVYPGAQELCNGIDDDCDRMVDGASADAMWYLDLDRDGYGDSTRPAISSCEPQAGRVPRGGDCDDGDASIHPRVPDLCDGIDADCDGSIDENGVRFAYFPDADGDGWGASDAASIVFRCTRPAGTVERPGDCDDTRATRYPTAPELCQGLDDDCDPRIDEDSERLWYPDGDGDGHGAGAGTLGCMAPSGHVMTNDDCDDLNPGNFPGNTERCNDRDEDCDGRVDEGGALDCVAYPRAAPTSACTMGRCTLGCLAGYADCNGVLADGCEADVRRSASYCGDCTTRCAVADTCGLGTIGVCDSSPVVALDGGNQHTFAVRATGGVAVWGPAGSVFQTGLGIDARTPLATDLAGVTQIAASSIGHACALLASRRVACWGLDSSGQLGDGTVGPNRAAPLIVPGLADVVHVSAGGSHTCAVLATGEVYCWGLNVNGQLGDGTISTRPSPTAVVGITDAVEVYAASASTCARRGAAGAYYVSCWGSSQYGAVGNGTTAGDVRLPRDVTGLPPNLAGFAHGSAVPSVYVITSDGRAYGWGYNQYGELGIGGTSSATLPTLNPTLTGVVEMSLGSFSSCARVRGAAAGTFELRCWGYNSGTYRWIDTSTAAVVDTPVQPAIMAGIDDLVAIHVGEYRWCAARRSGGVICMGEDLGGGLGNDDVIADSLVPVSVAGLP